LYPKPEPYSEYGPVLETPNEYGSDRFRFRLRNPAKDTRYCIVKANILREFYEILDNFSNRDFTDWQGILFGLSFQREVPFYLARPTVSSSAIDHKVVALLELFPLFVAEDLAQRGCLG
jgi:hypothetical protein